MFFLALLITPLVFLGASGAEPGAVKLPAFPGAEGFGAHAVGGRGGKVRFVTTLADSGPGSFREACESDGPRIVLFRVSGVIELKSHIAVRNPYITIAGQTALGDGICLKNSSFGIFQTHDVIVRYMRFRPGDTEKKEVDACDASESTDVIFDHCSASWAIDEIWSTNKDCKDLTTQWCLIAEALHKSYHKKGPHGYGSLVSSYDGGITMHHNVYAHNSSRNPRAGGEEGKPGVVLDFRNNLIYDWGFRAGYTGRDACRVNYINNYLKPGPSTWKEMRAFAWHLGGASTRMFLDGNRIEDAPEKDTDNWLMVTKSTKVEGVPGENPPIFGEGPLEICRADKPFSAPPVPTTSAEEAYRQILDGVGATLPKRDPVDERIIEQIRTGAGRQIDSQSEVGGWPEYHPAEPPVDTDSDGMPDAWEEQHGLDSRKPDDANLDADSDGYTNIEEYLNATDPARPGQ